jgi:hypothetical protein
MLSEFGHNQFNGMYLLENDSRGDTDFFSN